MTIDIELAKIVSEDLDFLFNDWNQDIDDASLRRSSPVLRALLVEGLLAKVARQANREIRIMAPAICSAITETELKEKIYYQSGGAKYNGMIIQSFSFIARAKTPEEIKAEYERTKNLVGKSLPIKLSSFLKQASFVIDGTIINREEVIKYVTNKLGGAHFDSSRTSTASCDSLDDKYQLLDKVRNELMMADKNAIYYELLSIGQRIVNSRDIRHLRKHLSNIITLRLPPVIYCTNKPYDYNPCELP